MGGREKFMRLELSEPSTAPICFHHAAPWIKVYLFSLQKSLFLSACTPVGVKHLRHAPLSSPCLNTHRTSSRSIIQSSVSMSPAAIYKRKIVGLRIRLGAVTLARTHAVERFLHGDLRQVVRLVLNPSGHRVNQLFKAPVMISNSSLLLGPLTHVLRVWFTEVQVLGQNAYCSFQLKVITISASWN